jgi:Ca2+-binding EF-hand superfamily protein
LTDSPKNNISKEDLEVALQIFDHTNIKNQPIDYRNLVRILDGRIEKKRINQAIDRLTDSGVIVFGV